MMALNPPVTPPHVCMALSPALMGGSGQHDPYLLP